MKLKRLFTAILSAALTLSLCAMPAMADSSTTGATGTPTNGTPVWSKTTGSITIHKYEYNGSDKPDGTGVDNQTVPEGAKELGGVTFEIYKVHDEAWLKDYYGGKAATGSQDFSKIDAGEYYSKNPATGAITVNSGATKIDTVTTETSGAKIGVAEKTGLALGLYLVVETKAPDKVTAPAKPFLVSVPMTRIDNTTTTNKLTDWIYDVHVYPKNATTYAGITISKSGYTGSKADGALSGVEFVLEKATPATTAGGTETWNPVTNRDDTGVAYKLTTDEYGKIVIDGLSQGKYRIHENAYTTPKGYILDAAYHEFTVNANGEITYDGRTSKPATISLENYRPDMKKEVKNGDSWKQDAQYGVGDTVPYKITIQVPKNIDKLSTFTVTDTPTNLEDKTDTINVVKVKAVGESSDTTLEKNTDYTVVSDASTGGFTLTFNQTTSVKACAGRTVTITYDAVVKDTAVVGGKGNSNNAKLTYTNKINSHDTPAAPSTNTIEDSAVMYSFGIKVVKTAGDTNAPLKDVVFDLYRVAKTGETSNVTPEAAKKAGLADTKSWILVKSGLTTGTDGIIDTSDSTSANYTHGLANGDYYLVETKTVKDYNLLTEPVKVELDVTATTTTWLKKDEYDASGNLVKHSTVKNTTFTHNKGTGDTVKPALVVANIINRKGFELPVTGGFGTLLFSGIGLLLVLVGVSVLFSLKKKTNRA